LLVLGNPTGKRDPTGGLNAARGLYNLLKDTAAKGNLAQAEQYQNEILDHLGKAEFYCGSSTAVNQIRGLSKKGVEELTKLRARLAPPPPPGSGINPGDSRWAETGGLHIEYLPVNQAWALMWLDQVLRIFNKRQDAVDEMNRILLRPRGTQANPRSRRGAPLALGRTWSEEKHKPKGAFDPGSFRYKRVPSKGPLKAYLLLGCPKGYWHPAAQRCEIAQELHVVMRPGRRVVGLRRVANPGACPPGIPPQVWHDPRFQAELRAYRKRHGRGPVEIRKIKVPKGFPKFLSVYGTAAHAVYDAPRHSSKGKRIHHFGRRGKHQPWLVSSVEAGPKFLSFVGGTFKARPDWIYD
jgi:hypothetical protein